MIGIQWDMKSIKILLLQEFPNISLWHSRLLSV